MLASAASVSAELPELYPCIYSFPDDGVALRNNILTLLPSMKATGGCGTIFSGGIDSFNGVYSRELTESELDLNGHANIRNSEYYIFCTEDYLHGNNH